MYVFPARIHALQPDQIGSIRHVELTTSYAKLGGQLEIVNEASDLLFNTLTMVIDSTERTGLRLHTVARGLSAVTNIDKIFVNNGFFRNPTLWSIYKVLSLRDDDTISGRQPKPFDQHTYIMRYDPAQESGFNRIVMTPKAVGRWLYLDNYGKSSFACWLLLGNESVQASAAWNIK